MTRVLHSLDNPEFKQAMKSSGKRISCAEDAMAFVLDFYETDKAENRHLKDVSSPTQTEKQEGSDNYKYNKYRTWMTGGCNRC